MQEFLNYWLNKLKEGTSLVKPCSVCKGTGSTRALDAFGDDGPYSLPCFACKGAGTLKAEATATLESRAIDIAQYAQSLEKGTK